MAMMPTTNAKCEDCMLTWQDSLIITYRCPSCKSKNIKIKISKTQKANQKGRMKVQLKWKNGEMIMSSSVVCENYTDMKHFNATFEKVGDNKYKCTDCNTLMTVKEPVLVHDDNGRLKMQISTELKH